PVVALVLGRPRVARDVLVDGFAAAEGGPEPAREHQPQGRDRLRDDRRVVALTGGVDDPEAEPRRRESGAEPRPGESGLALPHAPRLEMVGAHRGIEPRALGRL